MHDAENTHRLNPAARAIHNELSLYHFERLLKWQEDMSRKDRAARLAETKGIPNVARAIMALSTGSLRQSAPLEAEVFKSPDNNPQRILVPFTEFRDLTKGTASAGGYLVNTEVQAPVDTLRPWSVTARAGLTVDTGLVGDQAIPKTTGKATPAWLSTEVTQASASTPTLGQLALTPKHVSVLVNLSRLIALQGNGEKFVRRELMRTVGTAIDQAVLNGTGVSGQPLGLLNTNGIGSVSGAALSHSGVVGMKRNCTAADAPDDEIAFIGTPAVREVLEARERATGSGFIWNDDRVASRPAFVSTDVPAATLMAGAWSAIYLGIWGAGFVVEINPFDPTNFKSGIIQARIIVTCDIAVLYPAAFSVATAIT